MRIGEPIGIHKNPKRLGCPLIRLPDTAGIIPALMDIANPEDFIFLRIRLLIQNIGLEAERAIRTAVLGRKNCYGSRAEWSGTLAAMLWTVWMTAIQNGRDPLGYFTAYAKNWASTVVVRGPGRVSAPADGDRERPYGGDRIARRGTLRCVSPVDSTGCVAPACATHS